MPAGSSPRAGHGDIDLQRRCSQTLEEWHVGSPSKARRRTQHIPDGGGFTMDVGPYCHFASRNGVSAVFSGEVSAWPGVDLVSLSHDGDALPPAAPFYPDGTQHAVHATNMRRQPDYALPLDRWHQRSMT